MRLQSRLASLLAAGSFERTPQGFHVAPGLTLSDDQRAERELRERVAAEQYDDYLAFISRSHSIPVMDREVDRFLEGIPPGGVVLDVGGCWGWHWRRLADIRPDVGVLIIDFVQGNLQHASRVLGPLVGTQVALMHADATALPFPDASPAHPGFDGVWSVQVFQHIPNFGQASREAHRVLNTGGRFATYSLHVTPLNRAIYSLLSKPFHVRGTVAGQYHLERASEAQRRTVEEIFGRVSDRYTECLFHPDLKLASSGRLASTIGRIDAVLSDMPWLGRLIARQRSFEATKG